VANAYLSAWFESCPPRMQVARLEQADAARTRLEAPQLADAVAALARWASADKPSSLLITGPPNTGKTWLACGAIRQLVQDHPLVAMYASVPSLDLMGRQEADIWRRSAIGCDVLMLDDIDQPNDSQRRVRQVIMERYNARLPLIACSVLSLAQLRSALDDWLVRRLSDGAMLVEFE